MENQDFTRTEKVGKVRKCPSCGAPINGFVGACPECGYEFVNTGAVLSSSMLEQKLSVCKDQKERCRIIMDFPVPNTKEDLIEFITSMGAKADGTLLGEEHDAYETKYNECKIKANALFPNDKVVESVLKLTEKSTASQVANSLPKLFGRISFSLIVKIILLVFILYFLYRFYDDVLIWYLE